MGWTSTIQPHAGTRNRFRATSAASEDFYLCTIYVLKDRTEPAHEIMVLMTYATSEGSEEPARNEVWQ